MNHVGDNAVLSLLWMVLCIVVIVGMAYWFTKFVASRNGLGTAGTLRGTVRMNVLARMSMGKDRDLLLVQVDQRYFLLGSAPGGISALAEFSQEEAAAWASQQPEKDQTMSFGQALQTVIAKKKQR